MTVTTEDVATARPMRRRPSPRRRATYVVAVVLVLALLAALDWTAYRMTHIALRGVGQYGGVTDCTSGTDAAISKHGLAIGLGGYGVDRPGRVTFDGVTAVSASPSLVIDRAFLIPGILLGSSDYADLTGDESLYQLQNTVNPGQQIFSIPKADQNRYSGDQWNLIVVVRTTDPTAAGSIKGFKATFSSPWHVSVTDTIDAGLAVNEPNACGGI